MPDVTPSQPFKSLQEASTIASGQKIVPKNAEKTQKLLIEGDVFAKPANPQSTIFNPKGFLGLADLLEIDHPDKHMRFLKDYSNPEFIDEINAYKNLPIVDHALKQISHSFSQWDNTDDRAKLRETLANQFNNLSLLIDILTDILPYAGDKLNDLRETPELIQYFSGEKLMNTEDVKPFEIRDQFLKQLQKREPK